MKLSDYARKMGVCYKTAWNYWKSGQLDAIQLDTGTIIVTEPKKPRNKQKTVVYSRVSSSENKDNLLSQADRLIKYCTARGYNVVEVIKEIGSGVNDDRRQLIKLLSQGDFDRIVVEHKDRLTRFGFNYIEVLLKHMDKEIEVVNRVEEEKEDLIQDFVSIITSFCARIYGQRRTRRKTESLIKKLEKND